MKSFLRHDEVATKLYHLNIVLYHVLFCVKTWSGVTYRRVITTVVYSDGTKQSTAQDYAYDKLSGRWIVSGLPFDYRGPGVAPAGPAGCSSGGCGDDVIGDFFSLQDRRTIGTIRLRRVWLLRRFLRLGRENGLLVTSCRVSQPW